MLCTVLRVVQRNSVDVLLGQVSFDVGKMVRCERTQLIVLLLPHVSGKDKDWKRVRYSGQGFVFGRPAISGIDWSLTPERCCARPEKDNGK